MTEPENATQQRTLSSEQVGGFHHDHFVNDQTRHFIELAPNLAGSALVVDAGGGCDFFARRLKQLTARPVRVIDMDPASVRTCHEAGVQATRGMASV